MKTLKGDFGLFLANICYKTCYKKHLVKYLNVLKKNTHVGHVLNQTKDTKHGQRYGQR